ncbi:hypothetical protein GCM10022247_46740 [Allokutzneria multivorans]|uniref:Uncharacterized protein n=1 Tax=Allokutzneria multivorans TaxID=1142134 RepID=A0ABP7SY97_9PSEU
MAHVQFWHASEQPEHWQVAWLHVGHEQSAHVQTAQLSEQSAHWHVSHSS